MIHVIWTDAKREAAIEKLTEYFSKYSVGECINSVALSMTFKVKFINKSDQYLTSYIVSDIKEYIEDITNISDMHIPNLITLITNKYRNQIT